MMRRSVAYRGENSETGDHRKELAFWPGIKEQNRPNPVIDGLQFTAPKQPFVEGNERHPSLYWRTTTKESRMTPTRRDVLSAGLAAASATVTSSVVHAQGHDHAHDHDHQDVPSDPALRVKALESLMVAKGLVDRAALDALIDNYE